MLGLPSCKEVSELSSRLLEDDLSFSQRLKLKVHLAICKKCCRYHAQMKLTSETLRQWAAKRKMPGQLRDKLNADFIKQNSSESAD